MDEPLEDFGNIESSFTMCFQQVEKAPLLEAAILFSTQCRIEYA